VSDASDEEILDTSWVGEKGLHSLRNEVQSWINKFVKQYLIYHGRWQLSAVVMMAPMYLFSTTLDLPVWIAFPIVHVIGAIIFWYIDKFIFTEID
jgi:hypothetical protein